jgi:phenylpropionate dioxygenase-like ring-hydroxylating dioxygenase large terminal subunit
VIVDGVELVSPEPGQNLVPAAFTAPGVFEIEQRTIFAKSWVHVADIGDLPEPGSYVAAQIGRTPVLLVRDRHSGELRGFLNACRHRGAQLLDGKGTCDKQIKCPYHAWSYGTDGALLGIPFRDEFDCDASKMGLVPVRVGVVGPLVFACLDAAAPPLADWVGTLPAALAATDGWQLGFELRYEVAANWKLFVENANDGYHIPFVHDVLTDLLVPDSGVTTLERHSAYSYANVDPRYIPPEFPAADARIRFGCIFPNLIPVLSPSDLTYIRVDPVSHDRLALFVRSYDDGSMPHLREFRKLAFQRTTDQDIGVVERTMRGLHAHGLPAGIHAARLEERIGHFERMWHTALTDERSRPSLKVYAASASAGT